MKKMIIMVGLPGSGKSTRAQEIQVEYAPWECIIHSTDSYFIVDGVYRFDARKLHFFHQENIRAATESLLKGIECVIIDNTNICSRDRAPYINLAESNDYDVFIEVVGSFSDEHVKDYAARNVHGVPEGMISRMAKRFDLKQ